mgnify:CR=1 FL=1
MNKKFVLNTIKESESWKEGQCVVFRFKNFYGMEWELIFRKEEKEYLPFKYSVSGKKVNTHETINRRYVDAESAFLHIFNCFNENADIKDKYDSLDKALKRKRNEESEE